ncbi:hypothetical protein ACWFRJ_23415 [Streptomyces sp. NPDC055239]
MRTTFLVLCAFEEGREGDAVERVVERFACYRLEGGEQIAGECGPAAKDGITGAAAARAAGAAAMGASFLTAINGRGT